MLSIFWYTCWPFVHLLWWNVYSIFYLFFFKLGYLFNWCWVVVLFILSTLTFNHIYNFKIFNHSIILSFNSGDYVLWCTEGFNYDAVQFIFCVFCCLCSWCHIQEGQYQIQCHEVFILYSKSFIILGITFRSLIPSELIFVYGVREGYTFIILHVFIWFLQVNLL